MSQSNFQKKTYKKIDASSLKHSFSVNPQTNSTKKIIATNTVTGLREQFKRTFLPLLIDILEMRQRIENERLQQQGTPFVEETKSPQDILARLTEMQESVEETKRWCDGLIQQIERGIEEAKQTFETEEEPSEPL